MSRRWRYLDQRGTVAVLDEALDSGGSGGYDPAHAIHLADEATYTCPDCRDTGFRLFDRFVAGVPHTTAAACKLCQRGMAITRGETAALERKQKAREDWKRGNPRNRRDWAAAAANDKGD